MSSAQSLLSRVTPYLIAGRPEVFPAPIADVIIPTNCEMVVPTATHPPETTITEGSITWVTLPIPV